MLVIDPDECIDCTLCEPECPVEAIYADMDVPDELQEWTDLNATAESFPVIVGSKDALKGPNCSDPDAS